MEFNKRPIILPSNVDIDDDFIKKIKRLFDVDLEYSIEDMTEDDLIHGIRFILYGAAINIDKAQKYINVAKGDNEATTSFIFELTNYSISTEIVEKIEAFSNACLFPSSKEVIIIASNHDDGSFALSLLEQQSSLLLQKKDEMTMNVLDDDLARGDNQNLLDYDFDNYDQNEASYLKNSSIFEQIIDKSKNDVSPINKILENKELKQQKSNIHLALNQSNNLDSNLQIFNKHDNSYLLSSKEPPSKFHIREHKINRKCSQTSKFSKYNDNIATDNKDSYSYILDSVVEKNRPKFEGTQGSSNLMVSNSDLNLKNILDSSSECDSMNEEQGNINNYEIQKERDLRYIVIDGCNVAMTHGKHSKFSCRGIQIAVNYFLNRGHKEITVIVPQARRKTSDHSTLNPHILEQLYKKNYLLFSPTREINGRSISSYDDRYILDIACKEDAVVVSNDNYRDLYKEGRPDYKIIIEQRILQYVFHGDEFMPPIDPLGRTGPTLNDFLRHNNVTITLLLKKKLKIKKNKSELKILPKNIDDKILQPNMHKRKLNFSNKNINKDIPQIIFGMDSKPMIYNESQSLTRENNNQQNYYQRSRSVSNKCRKKIDNKNLPNFENSRPESVTKAIRDTMNQIFPDKSQQVQQILHDNPCESEVNLLIAKILDS